jgi:hypothetical protein
LLLQWLNDEVQLSEPVTSFHSSFRDGYLLGEILFRYNQLMTFDHFIHHGTPQSVLDNFGLLQPVILKIGVKFNSQMATEIMKGNESTTKSILYELKSALEAMTRNCRQVVHYKLRGTKHDRVANIVPLSRGVYDESASRTFKSSIRGALENTNAALMSAVTKKYEDRAEDYFRTISMGESMDQGTIQLRRQRAKDIHKSRKAHEGEFEEAWEALNVEKWRQNQRIAHERKELTLRVAGKLQLQQEKRVQASRAKSREYTMQSLENFDRKLETLILPDDAGKDLKFVKTFEVKRFDS